MVGTEKEVLHHIETELLTLSETNPRTTYKSESLEELGKSIATMGIISPLLVRASKGGFEIICGSRRFKASQLIGLKTLPCYVREVGDNEIVELQISENLDREDVHPMQEAEAIEKLLLLDFSLDDIAVKLAKSKTFVVQRLALNGLRSEWKKKFKKNEVSLTVAILIARLTKEHQKTMLDLAFDYSGNLYSTKTIEDRIEKNLMLELSTAVFDTEKEDLIPKCGSCLACPKRSGFNTSLFADIKNDNCFDRTCFEKKTLVHVTEQVKAIIEGGEEVVFVAHRLENVDESLASSIKDQKLRILESYEDFYTNGNESKRTTKAFWIEGSQIGNFVQVELKKDADNKKTKMSDLAPKEQIERIKTREIRSQELDAEKVQKTLVSLFKDSPKITDMDAIQPLPADVLMSRVIIYNSLGWGTCSGVGKTDRTAICLYGKNVRYFQLWRNTAYTR